MSAKTYTVKLSTEIRHPKNRHVSVHAVPNAVLHCTDRNAVVGTPYPPRTIVLLLTDRPSITAGKVWLQSILGLQCMHTLYGEAQTDVTGNT